MKKIIIATVFSLLAGVAFGQSFQKGSLVSIHEWTITPDSGVALNQFLDFQKNNYLPLFEKHMNGLKVYTVKSDGDEQLERVAVLWCWGSAELRARYFSEEARESEEMAEIREIIMPKRSELKKLGSWSVKATDWVIQ